ENGVAPKGVRARLAKKWPQVPPALSRPRGIAGSDRFRFAAGGAWPLALPRRARLFEVANSGLLAPSRGRSVLSPNEPEPPPAFPFAQRGEVAHRLNGKSIHPALSGSHEGPLPSRCYEAW